MFKKVLIANRGEIACRIIRTLDRLKIASVAVYSSVDADAQHVALATEAIAIGPALAADSYLRWERILAAAQQTGAEAIHPGYGFLSENAEFAEACIQAGIAFIGPTPAQMRDFGLKHTARALAAQNQVPLLPGTDLLKDVAAAWAAATSIGYPVMIKSTAGGGGIGLQLCHSAEKLAEQFQTVQRLSQNNFKQGGVYLERYVQRARHIEVQIFGDGQGHVVALGERDCSVQRRNQKVIEETPAPGITDSLRQQLYTAALRLGTAIHYQSAGTVEFVFDCDRQEFYFLEVNTRLQVEHGVTEAVHGVDLVEWMVRLAAGDASFLENFQPQPQGHSIQVRIYAEDPGKNFQPSSGLLTEVVFPDRVRCDTWIERGVEITPYYDPLIAKLIVHGDSRDAAIAQMQTALAQTQIAGIETNRDYLQQILQAPAFQTGDLTTGFLNSFAYAPRTIDVLEPGAFSMIQDYPGRVGYWNVGVPPSGPMDSLAFRYANRLVGNPEAAAGLELTVTGPTLRFNTATVICLTGAPMQAELDGQTVPYWQAIAVPAGGTLRLQGIQGNGTRTYLAVRGGFDVPDYLGSKATFTLGKFGGHCGRVLRVGDVLKINQGNNQDDHQDESVNLNEPSNLALNFSDAAIDSVTDSALGDFLQRIYPNQPPAPNSGGSESKPPEYSPDGHSRKGVGGGPGLSESAIALLKLSADLIPDYPNHWTIGVLYGPHGAPDFFTDADIEMLFSTDWEVHYNSARTGVRLIGPKPQWARQDGGEAGLHPSNIHDNAYAIGSLDFTGDMPIILGPDGPSLGGFVCPATIALAELWKIGQLKPGNTIRFQRWTLEKAQQQHLAQDHQIATLRRDAVEAVEVGAIAQTSVPVKDDAANAVLHEIPGTRDRIAVKYRRAGDDYLLIEYGPLVLDLNLRFRVHALMDWLQTQDLPGVLELTPGIRSLQIHYNNRQLSLAQLLDILVAAETELPPIEAMEVPTRIVHLPLSWDDESTRIAIDKYVRSVNLKAPWCPSNIEFIRRINGLESIDQVRDILFNARYLVLGLGDVYLGAPVATPIDPRHRLVTTKYNPARTWTPENAVGIGGAYLCVYGMEGPGGYQFVGRTVQMWNTYRQTTDFVAGKPWLLRFFDQIQFYPVSEAELLQYRHDFIQGKFKLKIEETTFSLRQYNQFLASIATETAVFKATQQAAFEAERDRWAAQNLDLAPAEVLDIPTEDDALELPPNSQGVTAHVPANVWQIEVEPGAVVQAGDPLIILESMKMEIAITAPIAGTILDIRCTAGQMVTVGQILCVLQPHPET